MTLSFNTKYLPSAGALILLVLFLCPSLLYAQSQRPAVDELIENFDSSNTTVNTANRFFDYLDKEEFTDQKIVFAKGTPVDSLRQQVWYWAAEWYNDVQEYAKAKEYALKALPLFRYSNMEKADCLNLLGIIHVRLGDFPSAASYAKQCVDIDMKLGDPDKISSSLNTLAGIYMAADQTKDAEKFILQGLEYASKADNPARKAILLGMASEIYHKLGDNSKSLSYARDAFRLDSIGERKPKMAMRLSQMASAMAGLKRYKESEATYIRAIAILKDAGNLHSVGIDLNQLGFVYLEQRRHSDAIRCFRNASAIFSDMGDLYNNVYSHKGLYESYWSLNPDSARIALNEFNTLKDSLYHQASAAALARYNAEFGRDRLQDEIMQRQDELKKTKEAHIRHLVFGIAVVLLLAIIALFIQRMRHRLHQSQMRQLVKEIETLQEKCALHEQSLAYSDSQASAGNVAGETNKREEEKFMSNLFAAVDAALTNQDYGVAKIASMMNMTERTFSRRLKELTGQTPKMFISAIQMERCAKQLMENPSKTIGEIAVLCGFEEASGFSHAFKRVFGCSPTAYREQHK